MGKYELIMFDMDGTLLDPKEGMAKAIRHALAYFNIKEENADRLESFIGSPQKEAYKNYYSLSDAEAELAVEIYRDYYKKHGVKHNKLYDGIKPLLKKLKAKNYTLAIATLKPRPIAETIARHFELDKYFDMVVGSEPDGSLKNKTEIIAHILEGSNIDNKEKAVMIGDRKYDIIGASDNGIETIGAGYGYGAPGELEEYKPVFIVNSVGELEEALLKS